MFDEAAERAAFEAWASKFGIDGRAKYWARQAWMDRAELAAKTEKELRDDRMRLWIALRPLEGIPVVSSL